VYRTTQYSELCTEYRTYDGGEEVSEGGGSGSEVL